MSKIIFDDLYKNFKGIVCIFDKNDVIEYTNKELCSLLGYNESELEGMLITDLIVHDEKSAFFDMFYFDYVKHDSIVKFYHRSGAFRFFSIKVYSLPKHNQILGNVIKRDYLSYEPSKSIDDIIEINNILDVENLLDFFDKDSKQLNLVLDTLPIDIWIKDRYHRYIFVNNTLCIHTNFSKEDYHLKNDFDIYDNNIANEFLESDQSAIEAKHKISFMFESKSSKLLSWTQVTKMPIFNKSNEYIGMIGFAVDISEIKSIEKSLEEEKSRLQFIIDNTQGLIFEISSNGDLVFSAGPLVKELDIYKKGLNILQYFTHDDKQPNIVEKLKLALTGESTTIETSINGIKLTLTFSPKYDADKNISILGFGNKA